MSPHFQRVRKTFERFVREVCRDVQVRDLPIGYRMAWVNDVAKKIYKVMKMDDPMPTIYRIVDHATEELFEEIWRWGRKVDRMQQEMKKNGL